MNRLSLFIFLLFIGACAPDTPTNSQGAVVPGSSTNPSASKTVKASALAPLIGSWEAEAVLGFKNKEDRENYEGIWFDLNGDQTFVHGQYEKQTHTGTYTFDEESSIIEFVFNPRDQKVANQYQLQGVGFKGTSTLIWLGNTPKNTDGMQLKMIKYNRVPAQ